MEEEGGGAGGRRRRRRRRRRRPGRAPPAPPRPDPGYHRPARRRLRPPPPRRRCPPHCTPRPRRTRSCSPRPSPWRDARGPGGRWPRRGEGGDAEAPALAPAPADVRTQAWLRPRGPRLLPRSGGWRLTAGGGGEGAEEGGRERGGRLLPASVRRGSAPASERKQSPAPPPRPLLSLLSQQRGVRHRVALRRRVTPLCVTAPRPAAPAWSPGRPHGPAYLGLGPELELPSRFGALPL